MPAIELPGPVTAINEVLVDGEVVDPAVYGGGVFQYRWLRRFDGGAWPCWQDLSADTTEEGTMQVTFMYGRAPDAGGVAAAQIYACEIAKALCPDGGASGECRLPERTRTVVRQGITFDIDTPLDFLDNGRTGLGLVDAWLASVNPAGLKRRSTVSRLG